MGLGIKYEERIRPGITTDDLPPEVVSDCETAWAYLKDNPNFDGSFRKPTKVERRNGVDLMKKWGLTRQGDKVDVRAMPPRQGDDADVQRFRMKLLDENARKPGRPKASEITEVKEAAKEADGAAEEVRKSEEKEETPVAVKPSGKQPHSVRAA